MAERGQRQHKITGYCKAPEEASAQLLTLQMLSAEAALLFWQHCWDLYVLTGDQGNISWQITLGIVESLYETNRMRLLTCISEGEEPASAVHDAAMETFPTSSVPVTWFPIPLNPSSTLGSLACVICACVFFCSVFVSYYQSQYLIGLYNGSSHNMPDFSWSECFGFFSLILPSLWSWEKP